MHVFPYLQSLRNRSGSSINSWVEWDGEKRTLALPMLFEVVITTNFYIIWIIKIFKEMTVIG